MLIRSLMLATWVAVAAPALAAGDDNPLAMDRGKSRPLVVIARDSLDPTLIRLEQALKEPANQSAAKERNLVLYTLVGMTGKRDDKALDPQSTMALIRTLKLGAGSKIKVVLLGKDGEKKLEDEGAIELKDIFTAVDQLPASEKQLTATVAPAAEAVPATPGKHTKPAKPAAPPKPLDD